MAPDNDPQTVNVSIEDLIDVLEDHQLWLNGHPCYEPDWSAHDRLSAIIEEATTVDEAQRGIEGIQRFLGQP
jgi:hypothetical protein